jgi:hypothetical protein
MDKLEFGYCLYIPDIVHKTWHHKSGSDIGEAFQDDNDRRPQLPQPRIQALKEREARLQVEVEAQSAAPQA